MTRCFFLSCLLAFILTGCSASPTTSINTPAVAQLNSKAQVLLEQDQPQQAIELLKAAQTLLPNEPKILYNLGIAYQAAQKTPEAIRVFEQLVSQDLQQFPISQQAKIYRDLGILYESQNTSQNTPKSQQAFTQAIALFQKAGQQQEAQELMTHLSTTTSPTASRPQ